MKSKIFAVATFAFAAAFAFTAAAATAMPMGGTTIQGGSNPAYVMALQTNLNVCAMANPALVADGKFGPKTTAAVSAFQVANGGLTVDGKAGPKTQAALVAKCAGSSTSSNNNDNNNSSSTTTLSGGAGDATITHSTTAVVNTVYEGDSNAKVAAFKAKADGSDLAVTALKVTLTKSSGSGSTRLDRYLSGVSVWMGSKKVGSADVSDFTKSGSDYSKTISLSNAVIKQDATQTFWISVDAIDSINTAELASTLDLDVNTVRFNDATGAILSGDLSDLSTENFAFGGASANDTVSITASTSNPQAANLMVKTGSTSDSYLVSAFKLKTGTDAKDVQINEMPVAIHIANGGNNLDAADGLIDSVTLKINGDTYESDSDTGSVSNGNGTQTYNFVFDNGAVVLAGDSSTDVKVYVKFAEQKSGNTDNYASGTTLYTVSSVSDAESVSNGDVVSVSGSSTSKTHSVSVSAPTFSIVGTPTLTSYFASDTATDVYLAKFVFNVTAGDDDIYLSSNTGDINYTQLGNGAINSVTLDSEDNTLQDNSGDFLITSGSTEKFTLSYYVNGNDASDKFTINGFTYGLTDGAADLTVTTGLSSFHTPTAYLAK
jgi:hypothetical protein